MSLRLLRVEKNKATNALVYLTKPSAADSTASQSTSNALLRGTTIAIKDNIVTKGAPTTCASNILRNFISPFDATVVQKLKQNGVEIIGKANCDEFGMGSLNTYSIHGPVVNPFSTTEARAAGGSSGGSAAAVASGMCDAALGTDTGGSIRLPASYCGVVGLKPSYGLVSRWGVVSYADSLDCVGVLAKDVGTTASVFGVVAAYDDKDPTSALPATRAAASELCEKRLQELSAALDKGRLDGLTIGIPQEFFPAELTASSLIRFRSVLTTLKSKGAKLVSVSLPSTSYSLSAYYVLATAEASSNLARYDGIQYGSRETTTDVTRLGSVAKVYSKTRSEGFGEEVKRRILLGTYALTADAFDNYFLQAQRVRQLVRTDFDRVFSMPNVSTTSPSSESTPASTEGVKVDILVHPSAIGCAPLLEPATTPPSTDSPSSSLDAYVQDVLTVPASLAGVPALNIPCPPLATASSIQPSEEWPIGASIVGQWGSEALVFAVAKILERARG